MRSGRRRHWRRYPGRASRWPRPRRASAASDDPPNRIRFDAASATRPDRTHPPRPRPRTTAAPRDLWRARTDRCRGAAAPSGRNAFQRRTARRRGPPPSSNWSDARCPPRKSTGSSRFEGASRHFSGRERAMNDQATWGSVRLQIVDFRLQIVLQIVGNSEIQSAICNFMISAQGSVAVTINVARRVHRRPQCKPYSFAGPKP